ncbi:MAG: Holliday junction resolvase RuvX [PVC group bacterium]
MGIDPGEKRIGLAVSDPLGITAQGLPTLEVRTPDDAVLQIAAVARRVQAAGIIIGLPLNMDGTEGEEARRAYRLGARLEETARLPVAFRDERLTSRQAEQVLLSGDLSRERRKKEIDRVSAQIILQCYLDEGGNSGA